MAVQSSLVTTYRSARAVTPSDTVPLPDGQCLGLFVTVAGTGTLSVIIDGTTLSLTGLTINTLLPFACTHVRATGTNATVVALY
jgi:hypothetical protein